MYDKFDNARNSTKMAAYLTKIIEAPNTTYKLQVAKPRKCSWIFRSETQWARKNIIPWPRSTIEASFHQLLLKQHGQSLMDLDADIIVFVYDKTDIKSFERVEKLVDSCLNTCTKNPCKPKFFSPYSFSHVYREKQDWHAWWQRPLRISWWICQGNLQIAWANLIEIRPFSDRVLCFDRLEHQRIF